MLFPEEIFFPARRKIRTKVAANPVEQLEFVPRSESVGIFGYKQRGIEGVVLEQGCGRKVLVVSKPTTEKEHSEVLLAPELSLARSLAEISKEARWLRPLPYTGEPGEFLARACAEVLQSWEGRFTIREEVPASAKSEGLGGFREPQMGAIYGALSHWTVTGAPGTIVMPTGTGKTETMLALYARKRFPKLLVVVPTSALRDQLFAKFLTMGALTDFGMFSSGAKLPVVGKVRHRLATAADARLLVESCNVIVATMSSLLGSEATLAEFADKCSHLFIDEAHHVAARTWQGLRDIFEEKGKTILQFTATPFRRDGKQVEGKSVYTYPLRKAQQAGYFTPINFISLWEYSSPLAERAVAIKATEILRRDIEAGYDHLLMARVDTIPRADEIIQVYAQIAPDLAPLVVHSDMPRAEQEAALEALRRRQSRIVVCVAMFGEGFDLPNLKVAALHDVHKSLAVTLQFIGRFTRSHAALGEATIVANAATAGVDAALEDLYAQDSDWNFLLRRLSEGANETQSKRSEFAEGFQNVPEGFPISGIRPKMSAVVYRTQCLDWQPSTVKKFLDENLILMPPIWNSKTRVLLYILREETPVAWGDTQRVRDLSHHLYLAFWDEQQGLLFINSTNKDANHRGLAKALTGEAVQLIQGENVYRALHDVKRLTLSNLGLLHLLNRATQFTMHVGNDIKSGLSQPAVANRRKSNLFGRGFEGGQPVTIGASYKGRIWAQKVAKSISEWVEWCERQGKKLLDNTISTEQVLKSAIIPEIVKDRPNLVPVLIEWPVEFLKRNEEAVAVEFMGQSHPFYDAGLAITQFTDQGPLCFGVIVGEELISEFEIRFTETSVQYAKVSGPEVLICSAGKRKSLTDWFQNEFPLVTFSDTSVLAYNEIFRAKSEWKPYDRALIQVWDWTGVNTSAESQYKKRKVEGDLLFRPDSVQRKVIDELLADDSAYDIVFDDDGAGEIADIVAIKVCGDKLLVRLVHCKWSQPDSGVRVGDFFEVCGQAQKCVRWRSDTKRLFKRLADRESSRQKRYGITRFAKGDLKALDEVRRRSRVLFPVFEVTVVQPGLDANRADAGVLDLLGATELYLRETFDVPLGVIASAG